MGSLLASLLSTAGALRAYDRSLGVIQNNVANADTPGFARQRLTITARRFDVNQGQAGGVDTGQLISYRDAYAERNVWRQTHTLGRYSQQTTDLAQVEAFFKISKDAGVAGALSKFFSSVSSWSINPNDPVARQVVLDRASATVRAFNENANALTETLSSADRQISSITDRINSLAGRVGDLSHIRRTDFRNQKDPALDAQIYSALEELSQLVDFNLLEHPDGSLSLLLGGQTPLVIGDRIQKIRADFSLPQPRILDENDNDITYQISDGSLKGALDTRINLLPSYQSDLNRLAESFADNVNQILMGGLDAGGSTPRQDLFTYDPVIGSAATLRVNPLTPSDLAAADFGVPGGNGNALKLAALLDARAIDNVSFHEFYGKLGARAGRDLVRVREGEELQKQLASQARALREDRQGVSLDEEAARLIEAQRAYQANAQLFTVLNSLTDILVGLLR